MKQNDEDIYGDGGLLKLWDVPRPNWMFCLNGQWSTMSVSLYWKNPPNRFHRLMQRLILGIHWKRI